MEVNSSSMLSWIGRCWTLYLCDILHSEDWVGSVEAVEGGYCNSLLTLNWRGMGWTLYLCDILHSKDGVGTVDAN
jgi:hypothetical protein